MAPIDVASEKQPVQAISPSAAIFLYVRCSWREVIVVLDHSKFNKVTATTVIPVGRIDKLVTDMLESDNLKVEQAGSETSGFWNQLHRRGCALSKVIGNSERGLPLWHDS